MHEVKPYFYTLFFPQCNSKLLNNYFQNNILSFAMYQYIYFYLLGIVHNCFLRMSKKLKKIRAQLTANLVVLFNAKKLWICPPKKVDIFLPMYFFWKNSEIFSVLYSQKKKKEKANVFEYLFNEREICRDIRRPHYGNSTKLYGHFRLACVHNPNHHSLASHGHADDCDSVGCDVPTTLEHSRVDAVSVLPALVFKYVIYPRSFWVY